MKDFSLKINPSSWPQKRSIIIFLMFLSYSAVVSGQSEAEKLLIQEGFSVPAERRAAPDFTLSRAGSSGAEQSLSSLRGKVVFLNFWTSWCNQCRMEVFSIERMYGKLPRDMFEILAVDILEPEKLVSAFAEEFSLSFPMLLDTKADVTTLYDVRAIPTTFIIDKNGLIAGQLVGSIEWDKEAFISAINLLLEE